MMKEKPKSKKLKKILIWSAVAIIVISIVASSLAGMSVETTEMQPQTAELSFTETGIVHSQNSIDVFAIVPGEIVSIYVQEGQQVSQGDILLVVDSTELQNQIRQIQAQDNGPNIAAQEVVVNQRQNELTRAEENEQRMLELYQAGASTQIEYQNATAAVEAAKSALESANAQLTIIRSSSAGTNSQIATLRQKIESATIRAPIDGTVSSLNVQNTNIVTQSAPVARITAADTTSEIEVFVSTKDISHIHLGDSVNITFEDRVQNIKINGYVSQIDARAQAILSPLGISEQRVRVAIGFDNSLLKEGFAVDVDFILQREENRLIVPKTAVFEESGLQSDSQHRVFVISNGRAQAVTVEKGIELRTGYVIENGLSAGDIVINDANEKGLRNGTRVRVTH